MVNNSKYAVHQTTPPFRLHPYPLHPCTPLHPFVWIKCENRLRSKSVYLN